MTSLGALSREKTVFVLVDIQEKFITVIDNIDEVIKNANIMSKAGEILKIPLIVTEQYSKGLGHTTDKITLPSTYFLIEKMHFSCFGSPEFRKKIEDLNISSVVLFGIEAHVCILKTALDALKNNIDVHVIQDAVSSRKYENKMIAIERMRQSGAFIVSAEMLIFQLLETAGTDEFREISRLIR